MNILIAGSNGQLGSEIKELTQNSKLKTQNSTFYFTDKDELNITNKEDIKKFVIDNHIDTIINCAAYTAVDKAENDIENANKINHLAVKYLAEISKEYDISLIHISTDYVYDGKNYKPYKEDDTTNPQGVYGETKLLGEKAMIEVNPKKSCIIRTSWVYSSFGANFVKTMLRLSKERDELGIIYDQIGTPTYARDLAGAILQIIQHSALNTQHSTEIYHYSNEGVCSWYDFAKAIFELSDIDIKLNPIETTDYPTPATRPHYSVLDKSKIKKEFDIIIPYWKNSLQKCIKILGENNV